MSKRIIAVVYLGFLLCGCNFPLLERQDETSAFATAQMALTLTAQIAITPSSEPNAGSTGQCFYSWGAESLPEETALLQNTLEKAGIAFISARVEAYGENCSDSVTMRIVSFSAMETDFHISLAVDDLNNKKEMGNIAYTVIKTILDFPEGMFPGENPGYIGIDFKAGANDLNLWFQVSTIRNDIINGTKGIELFNELNNR